MKRVVPVRLRRRHNVGTARSRAQPSRSVGIQATILMIVVILVAGIASGCGSSSKKDHVSITRQGVLTRAPIDPTVSNCISAWNQLSSPPTRRTFGITAETDSSKVVVATYSGPTRKMHWFGGPATAVYPTFPLATHDCMVISDDLVFVEQPKGNWLETEGLLDQQFQFMVLDTSWTETHANAQATPEIHGDPANAGILSAEQGAHLIDLDATQVAGQSSTH